jgi:hypothetical protein
MVSRISNLCVPLHPSSLNVQKARLAPKDLHGLDPAKRSGIKLNFYPLEEDILKLASRYLQFKNSVCHQRVTL